MHACQAWVHHPAVQGSMLLLQPEVLLQLDLRRPFLQLGSLNVAVSKALAAELLLQGGGRRQLRPLHVAADSDAGRLVSLALRQLRLGGWAALDFAPAVAGGSALLVAAAARLRLWQEGQQEVAVLLQEVGWRERRQEGRLRGDLQQQDALQQGGSQQQQDAQQPRAQHPSRCRLVLVARGAHELLGYAGR